MGRAAKWIVSLTVGSAVAAAVFLLIAELAAASSSRWPLALAGAAAVIGLSASIAGSWAAAAPVTPTFSIGHTVSRSKITGGKGGGTTAGIIGGNVGPSGTDGEAPEAPSTRP